MTVLVWQFNMTVPCDGNTYIYNNSEMEKVTMDNETKWFVVILHDCQWRRPPAPSPFIVSDIVAAEGRHFSEKYQVVKNNMTMNRWTIECLLTRIESKNDEIMKWCDSYSLSRWSATTIEEVYTTPYSTYIYIYIQQIHTIYPHDLSTKRISPKGITYSLYDIPRR